MTTREVSAKEARRLLMQGQGLCASPARRMTMPALRAQIEQLGFVQLDTINIIERAHHHIMMSRFDGYRRPHLEKLHHDDRAVFEHWTHDASMIRVDWLGHWKHRFHAFRTRETEPKWWTSKLGSGEERTKLLRHVKSRIRKEGPLMCRDFEDPDGHGKGTWWAWKPQKAALDYLWRCGELTIAKRVNFHKVFDLPERVYSDFKSIRRTSTTQYVDWACRSALDSLGVATPSEIRGHLHAVTPAQVNAWCKTQAQRKAIVPVTIASADGSAPKKGFALPDIDERIETVADPVDRLRILNPFDPALRDRHRMKRYWNFEYRFEAFVPEPKRVYGYYVLPLLDRDELVGRLDAKFHRDMETLRVLGVWWESKRPTKAQKQRLDAALALFAEQIGAQHIER